MDIFEINPEPNSVIEHANPKRFAVYPNLETYLADLSTINKTLGYPAKDGTQTYENPAPEPDEHGRYVMTVYDHVVEYVSVEIVESVPVLDEPESLES